MIKAKNLCKTYGSDERALEVIKNINLEIQDGEFVSVTGKSGSGKTTLLSLLAGLDQPTSGEVELEGIRIDHLDEEALAPLRQTAMGFVFQSFHLIPTLSALENVLIPAQLLGGPDQTSRAKDLLNRVGLCARESHLPSELSGGEQQRVAICRALINQPKIIFADEPTGNLDSHHESIVLDLLNELRDKSILVLVTHDIQIAKRAHRQIHLRDGEMVHADAA